MDPQGESIFLNPILNSNPLTHNENKNSSQEIIVNLRQKIKELEQKALELEQKALIEVIKFMIINNYLFE